MVMDLCFLGNVEKRVIVDLFLFYNFGNVVCIDLFFARKNLVLEKVTESDCTRGEGKSDRKLTQGVRSGGEAPTPIFWVTSFLKGPIQ